MSMNKRKIEDIYENTLAEHSDELDVIGGDHRDGFLDGAYVIYEAISAAAGS